MLFDPFEEQLDLPATAIELSDGQRRQRKVVGNENHALVGLGVEVTNAPQFVGITLARHGIDELDDLIANDACRSVHWPRIKASATESLASARHKEGRRQMQAVQTGKVEVSAIHHIESARLE